MASRLEIVRGAWGAILVFAPRGVTDHVLHLDATPGFVAVLRILGVRQISQAAMTWPALSTRLHQVGAGVDVVHALSMLAVGALSRTYRRAALADAIVAGTFAAFEFRDQRAHR